METKTKLASIKKASGVPIDEVGRFVKRLRTYMEPDGSSSQGMSLTTRENGDVGDEQPGRADFAEARRVGRAVLNEFGEGAVSVDVAHIGEWVTLSISLNHNFIKQREKEMDYKFWTIEEAIDAINKADKWGFVEQCLFTSKFAIVWED